MTWELAAEVAAVVVGCVALGVLLGHWLFCGTCRTVRRLARPAR